MEAEKLNPFCTYKRHQSTQHSVLCTGPRCICSGHPHQPSHRSRSSLPRSYPIQRQNGLRFPRTVGYRRIDHRSIRRCSNPFVLATLAVQVWSRMEIRNGSIVLSACSHLWFPVSRLSRRVQVRSMISVRSYIQADCSFIGDSPSISHGRKA